MTPRIVDRALLSHSVRKHLAAISGSLMNSVDIDLFALIFNARSVKACIAAPIAPSITFLTYAASSCLPCVLQESSSTSAVPPLRKRRLFCNCELEVSATCSCRPGMFDSAGMWNVLKQLIANSCNLHVATLLTVRVCHPFPRRPPRASRQSISSANCGMCTSPCTMSASGRGRMGHTLAHPIDALRHCIQMSISSSELLRF